MRCVSQGNFLTLTTICKNDYAICNLDLIYGARDDLKTEGRTGPEVETKRPIMKDTYWHYTE